MGQQTPEQITMNLIQQEPTKTGSGADLTDRQRKSAARKAAKNASKRQQETDRNDDAFYYTDK